MGVFEPVRIMVTRNMPKIARDMACFANDSSHVGRGSDVGRIVNRVIAARWETRGPRYYFSGGIGCHSGSCSSLRESHHPLAI